MTANDTRRDDPRPAVPSDGGRFLDERTTAMTTTVQAQITHVATTGVPVTDHERALGFYRDVLGFEVRLDATFGGSMRWVEVAPAEAETTIALMPANPAAAVGVDTAIRLGTDDAATTHAALQASGVD